MDLGSCPNCAAAWIRGDERCSQCGYTAIGAGLSALPKKKKRKYRPYREPGGSTPMLSLTLVVMLIGSGYYYKPWSEEWDLLRSIGGSGRHHALKGDWEITETLGAKDAGPTVFGQTQVATGRFTFDGDNTVKVAITNDEGSADGTGHYVVDGTTLNIFGLKANGDSSTSLPKQLKLTIAWTGPDAFVAALSKDDTIMVRRKEKDVIKELAHMAFSKALEDSPDSVRGLMFTLQSDPAREGDR